MCGKIGAKMLQNRGLLLKVSMILSITFLVSEEAGMGRYRTWILSCVTLGFALMSGLVLAGEGPAHFHAPKGQLKRVNPNAQCVEMMREGRLVYRTYCAGCHGYDARGDGAAGLGMNPAPPDLVAMGAVHGDGEFAWIIEEGRGNMPSWKEALDASRIWAVISWLRML